LQRQCYRHPFKFQWATQETPKKKNVQSLEYPERAEAELRTEYREVVIEKGHRPRDLRQEEESEL
jgi:hypothetical protein